MMIAPVIFVLLLGAFIFVILLHAGFARRTLSVGIFLALIAGRLCRRQRASWPPKAVRARVA